MYYFLFLIVGFLLGFAVSKKRKHKKRISGILKIDSADPDGPYLFLELNENSASDIKEGAEVMFKVEPRK